MTSLLPSSNTTSLVFLDMHPSRKSCLQPPQYSTCAVATPPPSEMGQMPDDTATVPIHVADKPKWCKWSQNVFNDDQGVPDEAKHYKAQLKYVDGGPILRKLKHPPPPLDEVNPQFSCTYDEATHREQMRCDLDLSHLDPNVHDRIYALIIQYWSVFNDKGFFVPVKNYIGVIDTGGAPSIAIKKILYGPKETLIVRDAIAALAKVGQIRQITNCRWLFKALLAPKPHQ
jgi:hypothetical protein